MGLSLDQSVFNTAAPADSSNVGAYLRDSAGNLIDSQLIATKRWLDVASALFDGSGNAITSTGGAIDINVKSGTIDVGVADGSAYTDGTTVEQPVGGVFATAHTALTTGKTGAFAMSAYRAMFTNLQDSAGAELKGQKVMASSLPVAIASDQAAFGVKLDDGTGNAITSTGGALDVNVKSADPALATGFLVSQVSPTTTAAVILSAQLAGRKYLSIQNVGNQSVYIGATGVTAANGYRIPAGSNFDARCGAAINFYAISANGTQDLRMLELS